VSWDWTTYTAIWGAVTGSYGAYVSTRGRRDIKWRRAAKQLPEVRPALEALRDAVGEARQNNRSVGSLRETSLRAHLEMLQESRVRVSETKLVVNLIDVEHSYSAILALDDNSPAHRKRETLDTAAESLKRTLDRVALIERKAPP
jgi:hypothetical protein